MGRLHLDVRRHITRRYAHTPRELCRGKFSGDFRTSKRRKSLQTLCSMLRSKLLGLLALSTVRNGRTLHPCRPCPFHPCPCPSCRSRRLSPILSRLCLCQIRPCQTFLCRSRPCQSRLCQTYPFRSRLYR